MKHHCPACSHGFGSQQIPALYAHAIECHPDIFDHHKDFGEELIAYFRIFRHHCKYCIFGARSEAEISRHEELYHPGAGAVGLGKSDQPVTPDRPPERSSDKDQLAVEDHQLSVRSSSASLEGQEHESREQSIVQPTLEEPGDFGWYLNKRDIPSRIQERIHNEIMQGSLQPTDCIFSLQNCSQVVRKVSLAVCKELKDEYCDGHLGVVGEWPYFEFHDERLGHVSDERRWQYRLSDLGVISNEYRQRLCQELSAAWRDRYETSREERKIKIETTSETGEEHNPTELDDIPDWEYWEFWEAIINKCWGPPKSVEAPTEWQAWYVQREPGAQSPSDVILRLYLTRNDASDFFMLGYAYGRTDTNKEVRDGFLYMVDRNNLKDICTQVKKCKAELQIRLPHINIDVMLRDIPVSQSSDATSQPKVDLFNDLVSEASSMSLGKKGKEEAGTSWIRDYKVVRRKPIGRKRAC
ncbi:hypothetical protein HD806DRAFT_545638 [Xylariaceae sp. AK1471]|nr:hypothetical protein HD806DRAFT_545638 [Xylariaceae sp. AK1471]